MKLTNLMETRVLVVENRQTQRLAIERYINEIDHKRKDSAGIESFEIRSAATLEEAIGFLKDNPGLPFNIVLLDLNLDDSSAGAFELRNDPTDSRNRIRFKGFQILEFILEDGSAEAVIVVSGFPEDGNLLEAFRCGASDFIIKPHDAEELQERFLICWSRLLVDKSQRIVSRRISNLLPYAEKAMAQRFTRCFSDLTQEVVHTADDLEKYMNERYGLDNQKDAEDFFFKCLERQNDSISRLKGEWKQLQNVGLSTGKPFLGKSIKLLLEEIHRETLPCLIVKRITLDIHGDGAPEILSMENDVRAVLTEIVIGALNDLPDYGPKEEVLDIAVKNTKGQVTIRITDNQKPITKKNAQDINAGSPLPPEGRFDREWGLSLVQHIAILGGGRLKIEPKESGNVVTYYIPTAT